MVGGTPGSFHRAGRWDCRKSCCLLSLGLIAMRQKRLTREKCSFTFGDRL